MSWLEGTSKRLRRNKRNATEGGRREQGPREADVKEKKAKGMAIQPSRRRGSLHESQQTQNLKEAEYEEEWTGP